MASMWDVEGQILSLLCP
ncbi:hypothetical protein A2U01_0081659, partial [Trifolium medium]|nr:hypothetical protein [Trifolium medium]